VEIAQMKEDLGDMEEAPVAEKEFLTNVELYVRKCGSTVAKKSTASARNV